jgi:hypothetical protein
MRNAAILLVLPIILSLSCGGELVEGILIGAGSGKALSETQQLAEQKKTALIAEILSLREQLSTTTDPAEVLALQDKLDTAEQKQQIAELTDSIATQVKAGLERDWSQPASTDNLTWLLGAGATILAGYGTKKTLDDKCKAKAIARIKIGAKPPEERKIYEAAGPTA